MEELDQRVEAVLPLTVVQITKRALSLLPEFLIDAWQLFVLPAVIATMPVALSQLVLGDKDSADIFLINTAFSFLDVVVYVFLYFAVILGAADLWQGRSFSWRALRERLQVGLVIRTLVLWCRISIMTIGGLLLLILPGLVYLTKRFLAPYILVIENAPLKQALNKSKYLMSRGHWYAWDGPYARLSGLMAINIAAYLVLLVFLFGGGLGFFTSRDFRFFIFLFFIINLLFSPILLAFGSLLYVGFYYDLQLRYGGTKDGPDAKASGVL